MEELKPNRTYNPCDECPYGVEKRDGSGNDSMCKICEFAKLLNRRAEPIEPSSRSADALEKLILDIEDRMTLDVRERVVLHDAVTALRRAAPENKALTLDELRGMDGGWVWLIDTEHPEYDGWYNVRPFHDGSGGIELYGVDNNYYERAITAGSVKVCACKPEGSESHGTIN